MTKSPENMSGKDQKTFLAIKQGIRDKIPQKELGVYIGQKKSYVGYFLGKYGIDWKKLKAEILLGVAREKSPERPESPQIGKKAIFTPVVKPVEPPIEVVHSNITDNIFPEDIEKGVDKITSVEFNAEDLYLDPNRPKSEEDLDSEMKEYSSQRNQSIINNATEITEEFLQALLIEKIKKDYIDEKLHISAITEVRNYLDKTDKLVSDKSELNPDDARMQEIEEQAQKVLDGVFDLQLEEQEKSIMQEDLS